MMSSEKVLAKSMVPSWPHLAKKSCKEEHSAQCVPFATLLLHMMHLYLSSRGHARAGYWYRGALVILKGSFCRRRRVGAPVPPGQSRAHRP